MHMVKAKAAKVIINSANVPIKNTLKYLWQIEGFIKYLSLLSQLNNSEILCKQNIANLKAQLFSSYNTPKGLMQLLLAPLIKMQKL